MSKSVAVIGAGISGLCTAALLAKQGISVELFEKSSGVGGRTRSVVFRQHILDNGFHVMPFYKTSSVYTVLKQLGITNQLRLAKVDNIAFYEGGKFHKYPRGIADILSLTLLPISSRIALLKLLIPMAFSSIEKSEKLDSRSLKDVIEKLDSKTRAFFDAICMLAFADTPENVAHGEFIRTIIRANPFKGGTSEFAYPADGGYDTICKLVAKYVTEHGGKIHLSESIKQVKIVQGKATGIIKSDGEFVGFDSVVVSQPAYLAVNELFEKGTFDGNLLSKIQKLNKTTSVIEAHYGLSKKIDSRQVVFPVGQYTGKGIFFVSNITDSVSPPGEHLVMVGTPVPSEYTENPQKIREITAKMKQEMSEIYPEFEKSLVWERPMAWKLVEAVVKEPGLVWKQKMPHSIAEISGLFFVGDSTISYGIGTDSAAQSSILCHPKIVQHLSS